MDSGVEGGSPLRAFASAAVGRDAEQLAQTRRDLAAGLGDTALVDASAVVGNFNMMDRIADATGIALDAFMDTSTRALREELRIGHFASARNTAAPPPPGG